MGGRGRKQTEPRGLLAYLVEIQECDGQTVVPSEFTYLVRKCVEDKIFSDNPDHISICRSDATSSFSFVACDWDGLRKAVEVLNHTGSSNEGGIENPITCILDIIRGMDAQMEEDDYKERKILYFASLSSYILDEKEVTKLADKLLEKDIFLSIILPNKMEMSDIQRQNSKLLKDVFEREKYDDISCIMNLKQAKAQILNTVSKKGRSMPWNVPLEITPRISINVSGFVCTRKNKIGEMAKVYIKQGLLEPENAPEANSNPNQPVEQSQLALPGKQQSKNEAVSEQAVVVEVAKKVLEKEQIWTGKDGTAVDPDEIGKAYYFGDKLIQCTELDEENSYSSGEKCLKLLAFCPIDNINPAYLSGDGTTLFYPRKDDIKAEMILRALVESMVCLQRVAIVRKVYRKGCKALIGALFPDKERECLVFTELCFADDISIPRFPSLVNSEENAVDEDEDTVLSENEELMDKLIIGKSLDDAFNPMDGPADPAIGVLREQIASKILKGCLKGSKERTIDNLDIFFEEMVLDEGLVSQIREAFPLKVNKAEEDRPAGSKIFLKRPLEELGETEVDKKPKMELEEEKTDLNKNEEKQEDDDGIDDLMDEF